MTRTSRASLAIIFVTVFIDLLGFGIVLPLLPRYGKAFLADYPEDRAKLLLGLLMASFSAMQFLFAPVWGRLSDRIGRRPVLLIGLAGSAVFYALFGYATSIGQDGQFLGLSALTWLFLTRIGAGIAGATIPTAQAYIADVTGEGERNKGMALIGAAFGIGFTFGPLIGAAFVSADPQGPPSPMAGFVASAMSGLALLWAIGRLPESLQPGMSIAARGSRFRGFAVAIRNPGSGLVLLAIFLTTFAFAQFETTLSLLTRELQLGDRQNFYVFAYVGFVLALAQGGIVRRLATRLKPQVLAAGGSAVMAGGLLLIGLAAMHRSQGELYGFMPIAVLGFSALTPSLQAILSLRTPAEQQGEVLGVGQSMSALARILGPVAGMKLFDAQHLGRPYLAGAALMVVGGLLVSFLRTPRNGEVPSSDEGTQP